MSEEKLAELVEITGDEVKAKEVCSRCGECTFSPSLTAIAPQVIEASKSSMGQDISPIDLINIERFAGRVIALAEYRQKLHTYLLDKVRRGM